MNDWTIVITFIYPHEAYLAGGVLRSQGFEVEVRDDKTAQINNFYSTAIGGVKLLVPKADARRAHDALKEAGFIKDAEEEDTGEIKTFPEQHMHTCPYCHSGEVVKKRAPGYIVLFSILLLGFPLPFIKKRYYCFDCQKEWRVESII